MVFYTFPIRVTDNVDLKCCAWSPRPYKEATNSDRRELNQLVKKHDKILQRAKTNGTSEIAFSTRETVFDLPHLVLTKNKNQKFKKEYRIVGLQNEIVACNDGGRLQVVPKFGIADKESGLASPTLIEIANFDRYMEWCANLRDGIVKNGQVDRMEWTSVLQSGLEAIYDLRCIHQVSLPLGVMAAAGDHGESYTFTFHLPVLGNASSLTTETVANDVATEFPTELPLCVVCMEGEASYVMQKCRHLTHCGDCRQNVIDHDRKSRSKYHEKYGPSQRLSQKALQSYTLSCPICRTVGRIAFRKGGNVLIP